MWLQILTRCVDEDVAILTDESYNYRTKSQVDPLGGVLPVYSYDLTLSLSALGVAVRVPGNGGLRQLGYWCYHDVVDWAVFRQNGKLTLRISVLEDGPGSKRLDFVVRSPDAVRIASCLEICIEKYMSFLSVRTEVDYMKKLRVNHTASSMDNDSSAGEPSSDVSVWDTVWDTREGGGFVTASVHKYSTLPASLRQENASRLHEVMVSKHGALFSDSLFQVAVTEGNVRVHEGRVRIELFYRNHGVVDINDLACAVSGGDNNFAVELSNMPKTELSPCGVSGQTIEVVCMGVGSCSLSLELSYTNAESDRSCRTSIRLPVSVSSFVCSLRLSGDDYAGKWAAMTGVDCEITEVFQAPQLLNPFAVVALMEEVSVKVLVCCCIIFNPCFHQGLGFGVVDKVPGWPDSTLCGAGQLFTMQNSRDQISGIECLIRMEMNTARNVVRVTARSFDPRLPAAIVNAVNFLCFGWVA